MTDSEKGLAQNIVYQAADDVGALMLRQAEERLKALQTAAHSLDQRITQVAGLHFAAAAVSAGLSGGPAPALGALAALSFLVGGMIAFRGIRSDPIHLPGIPPVWWERSLSLEPFNIDQAQGWAASAYQTAITEVDVENCTRAKHLNLSLRFALGGATLMALSAFVASFR